MEATSDLHSAIKRILLRNTNHCDTQDCPEVIDRVTDELEKLFTLEVLSKADQIVKRLSKHLAETNHI